MTEMHNKGSIKAPAPVLLLAGDINYQRSAPCRPLTDGQGLVTHHPHWGAPTLLSFSSSYSLNVWCCEIKSFMASFLMLGFVSNARLLIWRYFWKQLEGRRSCFMFWLWAGAGEHYCVYSQLLYPRSRHISIMLRKWMKMSKYKFFSSHKRSEAWALCWLLT